MRILLVADIHYALKQYDWLLAEAPQFDVVCIAGDLLEVSSIVSLPAQVVVVRTYLERLAGMTSLLVCSGNHDLTAAMGEGERIAPWLSGLGEFNIVADGEAKRIGDTQFSVFPWWDGPQTKAMIADQLHRDASTAPETWIWVHHAPPADSPTSWGGSRHFGDTDLTHWIDDFRPAAVFSGHVHQAPFIRDGSWVDRMGGTWVFNMGNQMGPIPAHIIIDTDTREAFWFSQQGQEVVRMDAATAAASPLSDLPEWLKPGNPTQT